MAISKKSVGTLTLVKITGAVLTISYSVLQVHLFGVSRDIEIYFAAVTLLHTFISITQAGHLAEIYLPIYHRILEEHGRMIASKSFSTVVNWMGIGVLIICTATIAVAPYIVEVLVPGFSPMNQELTVNLLRFTIFLLLIDVLNSFIRTLLNAEGVFGKAEFVDVMNTIISIVILMIFFQQLGIWSLVLSLVISKLLSFVIYIVFLKKIGLTYHICFKSEGFDHKIFFRALFNTSIYVIATQAYVVILTSSLSILPQGVFGVFKYVQNLYAKLRGVAIQPLITVFFTSFSKQVQHEKADLAWSVQQPIQYLIILNALIILLSYAFGDIFLQILWGSDKFGENNIHLAYSLLVLNCFALLISSVTGVYRKVVVSYGLGGKLYLLLVVSQVLTAVSVYFLITYLGTEGLLFVIPLNALFLGSVPVLLIFKQHRVLIKVFSVKNVARIIVIMLLSGVFGKWLGGQIVIELEWTILNRLWIAFLVIISTFATIGIFIILAIFSRVPEVLWVVKKVQRSLKNIQN